MRRHKVQSLLMGGQACVLYGAAEFSRDTDLAVLASPANLDRLSAALAELEAHVIAIPPFELEYLERGHAVHFASGDRPTGRMRIDVMSSMRNVAPFADLWERRTSLSLDGAGEIDLLSLPDLVAAKKTQWDKDWPMIRRLVEANYYAFSTEATAPRVEFWLRELRTPVLLIDVAGRFGDRALELVGSRPLLHHALHGDPDALADALEAEERCERHVDREYWMPLREELERLRRRGDA